MAMVPNHVGQPDLSAPMAAPHEDPNAGLWRIAFEAFKAASDADARTAKTAKPATFTEYIGRVTHCGGAALVSGVAQGGNVYRLDHPRRIKCHRTDADPKFGLCEGCLFEELQDRARLRSMATRHDEGPKPRSSKYGGA